MAVEITTSPPTRPDGATPSTGNSPVRRKGSLLDLKTDLKSLKFQDFGVSPAVVKDINDPPKYNAEPLQAGRRVDDLVRITKFIASANGAKFVAKQGILSQINQDRGGTRKEKLKASIKSGAISAAKVLGSTLAQVPVSGTGVHFIRGFGGYSYLTPGTPPSLGSGLLGKIQDFAQNKLGLGGGVNGSEMVLAGNNIILDYEGGGSFTPQAKSELLDRVKDEGAKFNDTFASTNKIKEDAYLGGSYALGPLREGAKRPILFDNEGGDTFTPQGPDKLLNRGRGEGTKFNPTFADTSRVVEDTYLENPYAYGPLREGAKDPILFDNEGDGTFTPQGPDKLLGRVKDEGAKFNPTFADTSRVEEDTYLGNPNAYGPSREGSKDPIILDQRANQSDPKAIAADRQDEKITSLRNRNSDLAFNEGQVPDKAKREEGKGTPELTNFLSAPNTQTDPNRRPAQKDYKGEVDNLYLRANMGNQSARIDKSDVTKEEWDTVDKVNRLSVQTSGYDFEANRSLDIIPFEIEVISPDARTDQRYSTNNFLYFRAHLGSFSDDFTGNWNETKYVGRAEPMYSYDGFNRSVSFDFKIAAFSRSELLPLYHKLNFLASSTAPTYSSDVGFMRGTFSRLTVGDYLYQTPGFFNKIGISWEVGYPWEINLENDAELPKVPHILNVSCGFTPVHNFTPALNQPFLMKNSFYPYTPSDSIIG